MNKLEKHSSKCLNGLIAAFILMFCFCLYHQFIREGVLTEMSSPNAKYHHKKRITLLFLVVSALSIFADGQILNTKKLLLHYFGSETCGECIQVRNEVLQPFADKYPEQLELRLYDIEMDSGFKILIDMEKRYGVTKSSAQTLFLPDTFLTGAQDMRTYAQGLIEAYIRNPSRWVETDAIAPVATKDTLSAKNAVIAKFKEFSFLGILLAGIADGVNPCAIATMIFLISFLATQKRKRSEILVIGLTFTAAFFLTYLFMVLENSRRYRF